MAHGLGSLNEKERQQAWSRYQILKPYIEDGIPLRSISEESKVSLRTLQRWYAGYKKDGLFGLARKPVIRKQETSEEIVKQVEQLLLRHPHASISFIYRELQATAEKQSQTIPSYSTVYRIVRKIPDRLKYLSSHGTKKYREKYDSLLSISTDYPNEIWQADHTQLDIWVKNSSDNLIRPWLTLVVDDYTRMIAGYLLSEFPPNSLHTSLAFHHAINRKTELNWPIYGIPDRLYVDHGSDFTSKHLEQVAVAIKCQLHFSEVGFPRGRGKVERLFQTMDQLFFQHMPGHKTTSKKTKHLSLDELKSLFHSFLLNTYHERVHSSLKQSPLNVWYKADIIPRLPDNHEDLDFLLLLLAKPRIVRQDGIHFKGKRYFSPVLQPYMGEFVTIRYHPDDLTTIRIFFQERALCTAICFDEMENSELEEQIMIARNTQRQKDQQLLKELKQPAKSQIPKNGEQPMRTLKRYENE
ncbi:Mu transposase C-terminal domain-containing protein [Metabacillus niabensis]|uniref:Mu transposase C-terminal domain-containing protein n=1 Tax=Metabacillus niabensis TaxID=324854 RepID=UPI0039A16F8B